MDEKCCNLKFAKFVLTFLVFNIRFGAVVLHLSMITGRHMTVIVLCLLILIKLYIIYFVKLFVKIIRNRFKNEQTIFISHAYNAVFVSDLPWH